MFTKNNVKSWYVNISNINFTVFLLQNTHVIYYSFKNSILVFKNSNGYNLSKRIWPLANTSIQNLFGSISGRYDLANHVLSMGVDIHWRNLSARLLRPADNNKLLDMCCGTGDFAAAFEKMQNCPAEIIGCDFSAEMVQAAQNKYHNTQVQFSVQDCTETNFDDCSFDLISCGFGVRNFTNLDKGLAEMYRLLKVGGKVCILEFSLPKFKPIRWLYLAYFKYILPIIGGIIAGDFAAYRYFVNSVIHWDSKVDLKEKLEKKGFKMQLQKPLTFGIATIHIASKQ